MKILANYELKDMGEPIKETDCWLFFEKGKIAKHTIKFRYKSQIDEFREKLAFAKYQPISNLIN